MLACWLTHFARKPGSLGSVKCGQLSICLSLERTPLFVYTFPRGRPSQAVPYKLYLSLPCKQDIYIYHLPPHLPISLPSSYHNQKRPPSQPEIATRAHHHNGVRSDFLYFWLSCVNRPSEGPDPVPVPVPVPVSVSVPVPFLK